MKKILLGVVCCIVLGGFISKTSVAIAICVFNATDLKNALTTAASNGDDNTIKVSQGTYIGNFTYSSNGGHNITLQGGYIANCTVRTLDPTNTVLDSSGSGRVLNVSDSNGGNIFIEGLTVQNGNAIGNSGGGIYAYSSSSSGTAGTITLTHNIIQQNIAANDGGGIYVQSFSSTGEANNITISNNLVIGNSTISVSGGGVFAQSYSQGGTSGTVTFSNNTITANSATGSGGGVFAASQTNTAAAIAGDVIMTGNMITENTAVASGGGVYTQSYSISGTVGTVTLTNNTLGGNNSGTNGGGIYTQVSGGTSNGTINFYNNIVWGNTATGSGDDIYFTSAGTAYGYYNDYHEIFGSWSGSSDNNIDVDPLFIGNGDYRTRPSSPCVDAGLNSAPNLLPTDFEGNSRIMDGNYDGVFTVDMGAYEYWSNEHCVTDATGLQNALTAAQSNSGDDTIKVVQGTYTGNFTFNSIEGHSLLLLGGYTANCAGRVVNPVNTILDGNNTDTVLFFYNGAGGDIFVESFTIQNGYKNNNWGGGVNLQSSSPSGASGTIILNDNIITENSAIGGAGVLAISETQSGTAGTVRLTNNVITSNTATGGDYGGGIYAASEATTSGTAGDVDLMNNTISENSSVDYGGGGAFVSTYSDSGKAGTIHIAYNTITDNHVTGAPGDGGGVYVYLPFYSNTGGTAFFTGNTISGNSASGAGGGVYVYSTYTSGKTGTVSFTNNMIVGNYAGTYGGGVDAYLYSSLGAAGTVTLTNNTITGNTATPTSSSNGVYIYMHGASGGIFNAYNNIIWGNSTSGDINLNKGASSVANGYNNDYAVMIGSAWDNYGGNIINANPLFVGNGNYHLQSGSPCIDKGDNSAPEISDTDFDGDDRIVDGNNDTIATVDIGADEYTGPIALAVPSNETIFGGSTFINKYQPSFRWINDGNYKNFTISFSTSPIDFSSRGVFITKATIKGTLNTYTPSLAVWKKIMTSSNNNGTIRDIYWKIVGTRADKSTGESAVRHFRISDLLSAMVQSSGGGDPLSAGTPPTFTFGANFNVKLQLEISSVSDFSDSKKLKKFVYTVNNPNLTPSIQKMLSSFQWNSIVKLIGTGGAGYFRVRAWDGIKRETVSGTREFTISP